MRTNLLFVLPLLVLLGCPAPGELCTDCNPPPTDCEGCLQFEILVEQDAAGPGAPQPLEVQGLLRVAVVGFDRLIADTTATVVAEWAVEIEGLPFTLQAALPPEVHASIEPSTGDPANHTFYLEAWVDVDRDGELCHGDLDQATGALDTIPPQDDVYPVSVSGWDGDCIAQGG